MSVAIVTGGSRGIGRAIAVKLAAEGHQVVINYAGNKQAADETLALLSGPAIAVAGDVADEHAMADVFDRAEAAFGPVDVVVHAAGRMSLATVEELDLDEFDAIHRTNVRGAFVVNQLAARRLRSGGSIVNFSTSQVGLQFPRYAAYATSKGAVETLTLILAREMRGRNITVNAVAPGPTATDLLLDNNDQAALDRLAAAPPLERLGTPEDIAQVVAFLVSPAGHWVNGQVLRANGGII
jgi:3-oxoacyl-[acyl-carrier protein] reductase